MTNIAMCVEYNGATFNGWQTQAQGQSVQAIVEAAISRVADEPISTFCAGRTDAGVHALCQMIHFKTTTHRDARAWILGTNSFLPSSISIYDIAFMPEHFHARYSAIARTYQYVIYNHVARPGVFAGQVGWYWHNLDEARMQTAAQYLLGEHDFSAYRGAGCQSRSAVRCITNLTVHRRGDYVVVTVTANAFLYHMVRNIVGVLYLIGCGRAEPDWARFVLDSKDRTQAGMTAPPSGLYLAKVAYPGEFTLPKSPALLYNLTDQ